MCFLFLSRSYVKPSASLSEYLFAGEDTSDDVDIEVTESESAVDIRCNEGSSSAFNLKNFDAVDAEVRANLCGNE